MSLSPIQSTLSEGADELTGLEEAIASIVTTAVEVGKSSNRMDNLVCLDLKPWIRCCMLPCLQDLEGGAAELRPLPWSRCGSSESLAIEALLLEIPTC